MKKSITLALAVLLGPISTLPAVAEFKVITSTPSEVTLQRTPIHGVEIGMPVLEAIRNLEAEGFTHSTRIIPSREMTVVAEENRSDRVRYDDGHSWQRGDTFVTLRWTGADPQEDSGFRRFDGDNRVWMIERQGPLEEPSSYDLVLTQLKERFGITYPFYCVHRYSSAGRLQNRLTAHVGASGTGEDVVFPPGRDCYDSVESEDAFNLLRRIDTIEGMPDTSLRLSLSHNRDGLVQFMVIEHFSLKLVLEETLRFYRETVDALNSQAAIGAGLSDF